MTTSKATKNDDVESDERSDDVANDERNSVESDEENNEKTIPEATKKTFASFDVMIFSSISRFFFVDFDIVLFIFRRHFFRRFRRFFPLFFFFVAFEVVFFSAGLHTGRSEPERLCVLLHTNSTSILCVDSGYFFVLRLCAQSCTPRPR